MYSKHTLMDIWISYVWPAVFWLIVLSAIVLAVYLTRRSY